MELRGGWRREGYLMQRWHLRKGLDRRFRSGHPWVFSNEIAEKPTTVRSGELVELVDDREEFLAIGYANPNSLICFRSLTRDEREASQDVFGEDWLLARFLLMRQFRINLGFVDCSFRLCYGEGDFVPGLIVDRFVRTDDKIVYVVQAHTAGVDVRLEVVARALARLETGPFAIVIRNDLQVRKYEGLPVEEPRLIGGWGEATQGELMQSDLWIRGVTDHSPRLVMSCNLWDGQKTGYFLDQFANIQKVWSILKPQAKHSLRILDLCCYVGQWGSQLAVAQKAHAEVTAMDVSVEALNFTQQNVSRAASVEIIRGDVLKDLSLVPNEAFDVVICDPPAFIKTKKDIEPGKHAYMKLNADALKRVRHSGLYVACSCSALLTDQDFSMTLSKAARRAGVRVQWVGRGGPSPDHPILQEFPEAHYLKCWIGVVIR